MKPPIWLYHERTSYGMRTRRFGSRRPLRLVFTTFTGGGFSGAYMLGLGRLGVQFGPGEGICEGHAGMPVGSHYRAFVLPRGFALGVSWDGRW